MAGDLLASVGEVVFRPKLEDFGCAMLSLVLVSE